MSSSIPLKSFRSFVEYPWFPMCHFCETYISSEMIKDKWLHRSFCCCCTLWVFVYFYWHNDCIKRFVVNSAPHTFGPYQLGPYPSSYSAPILFGPSFRLFGPSCLDYSAPALDYSAPSSGLFGPLEKPIRPLSKTDSAPR